VLPGPYLPVVVRSGRADAVGVGMIACAALARLGGVLLRAVSMVICPGVTGISSVSFRGLFTNLSQMDSWWAARYRWLFWPSDWGACWAFNENSTSWGRSPAQQALLVLVVAFSVSQLFIISLC